MHNRGVIVAGVPSPLAPERDCAWVEARWKLHVPATGSPSVLTADKGLAWSLEVRVRSDDAPESTALFVVLVAP